MTTMALSLSAIRLALSSRRQASAHSAVAAVSLSSSSPPSSAAVLLSRHGQSQTRSFHRHNNNINNNKDASSSSSTLLSLWSDRYRNPLIFNSQDHSIHDTNGFCRNNEIRWFSSKRKGEKKSSSGATTRHQPPTIASNNDDDDSTAAAAAGSSQHNTWIQFQRSIAVTGFETGQTTREQTLQGKKSRGGKIDRKRKEREAELEVLLRGGGGDGGGTQLKGGEFPSLRYSDEETERLLAQAYSSIPPRTGKRGTNNLRRQKRRWEIKRQYDATKKRERIEEHGRRMKKRHEISKAMYNIRLESVNVREVERTYHRGIVERWAVMNGHGGGATMRGSGGDDEGVVKMEI